MTPDEAQIISLNEQERELANEWWLNADDECKREVFLELRSLIDEDEDPVLHVVGRLGMLALLEKVEDDIHHPDEDVDLSWMYYRDEEED